MKLPFISELLYINKIIFIFFTFVILLFLTSIKAFASDVQEIQVLNQIIKTSSEHGKREKENPIHCVDGILLNLHIGKQPAAKAIQSCRSELVQFVINQEKKKSGNLFQSSNENDVTQIKHLNLLLRNSGLFNFPIIESEIENIKFYQKIIAFSIFLNTMVLGGLLWLFYCRLSISKSNSRINVFSQLRNSERYMTQEILQLKDFSQKIHDSLGNLTTSLKQKDDFPVPENKPRANSSDYGSQSTDGSDVNDINQTVLTILSAIKSDIGELSKPRNQYSEQNATETLDPQYSEQNATETLGAQLPISIQYDNNGSPLYFQLNDTNESLFEISNDSYEPDLKLISVPNPLKFIDYYLNSNEKEKSILDGVLYALFNLEQSEFQVICEKSRRGDLTVEIKVSPIKALIVRDLGNPKSFSIPVRVKGKFEHVYGAN